MLSITKANFATQSERERVKIMHDMLVNKQVNEFTPIENDAINLYSQVTAKLYDTFSLLYPRVISPMQGDYEQLRDIFKTLNLVVVNDDNHPPYLTHCVNLEGRYVHDIIHYTMGYDFSLEGEYKTCEKQVEVYCSIANTMASSDVIKKMIQFIESEVKVQSLYHETYGVFPPYQVVVFS